jgi:two-component system LytT family response regulator
VIRVLIVDDEPLARTAIRNLFRGRVEFELVGEAEGGDEAVSAIRSLSPDLVFLDVQMPEVDGFSVLEALGPEGSPEIIFVTAYDQYAVRAFDVHAVDYLLKPFDRERFETALDRAQHRLREGSPSNLGQFRALLRDARQDHLGRLIVRTAGSVRFLPIGEIDWIEAQGNYVNVHSGGRSYLLREAIVSLEAKLDPLQFRRIHRSSIVNLASIRELRSTFHGGYQVILRDGTLLKLSSRYRANLEKGALGGL